MTERTLLLRTATEGRYAILATDFPSARVFDTATSRLACMVELPPRSRTSPAALSLSSVALGKAAAATTTSLSGTRRQKRSGGNSDDETAASAVSDALLDTSVMAAVGLSDGTVLIHDIAKDELVRHVSVSETQHAIIAMCVADGFLFCLAANSTLYVLDISDAAAIARGAVLKIRTQSDATAIALLAAGRDGASAVHSGDKERDDGRHVFRLLIAGPTHALHRVELHRRHENALQGSGRDGQKHVSEKLLAFASQGTAVDYAWLGAVRTTAEGGDALSGTVTTAVTASANEGVVRVWDMSTAADDSGYKSVVGRCRRTLLCGQRIANVSVLDLTTKHDATSSASSASPAAAEGAVYVLATTFTGAALLWNLGEQLLPRVVEPAPLPPTMAFVSASPAARLLYATLLRSEDAAGSQQHTPAPTSRPSVSAALSLRLMRGKFALPHFDVANVRGLLALHEGRLSGTHDSSNSVPTASREKQMKRLRKTASAMGLSVSPSLTLVEVAADERGGAAQADGSGVSLNDAAGNAFRVLDTAWAANRQRVATRALMTPSESFAAAHSYHAPSLKDLPVTQLTLEQRLRVLSASVAKGAADRAAAELRSKRRHAQRGTGGEAAREDAERVSEDDEEGGEEHEMVGIGGTLPSLGLATVPLYQALHANDVSAVMELLSVAARSAEGIRATVLSLQLPYALQLIGILSERLGITSPKPTAGAAALTAAGRRNLVGGGGGLASVSSRSPLLRWLDTLMHYRGMELYAAQLSSTKGRHNEQEKLAEKEGEEQAAQMPRMSPPKDFVAPVLHQYRSMCATYDKLATLHGRLSIFNAVRPSERNQFVNRPRKMLSSNIELARTPAALSGKIDTTHTVQDDDILFPAMFTELRTSKGPHVVRVRSKLAKEKKHRRLATSDRALLKKAKQMAKEDRKRKQEAGANGSDDIDDDAMAAALGMDENGLPTATGHGGLDDDDGDIDLEALEALGLGSDTDDDEASEDGSNLSGSSQASSADGEDDNEDEDEDGEEEGRGRTKKAARRERPAKVATDEMLADAPSSVEGDESETEDDDDAELDSSDAGADFAIESDDEVHSQVLDFSDDEGRKRSDDEDDDSDEEDEATSESDSEADGNAAAAHSDADDESGSEDDEDDGMGEDMAELLAAQDGNDDENAKEERRKSKRVRTDE